MTLRDIPIIPTIIVAAAIATMIALGFWQIDRAGQRDALRQAMIDRPSMPVLDYPHGETDAETYLYRRLRTQCSEVLGIQVMGGRSAAGRTGWKQIAECRAPSGDTFPAQIGIAALPNETVEWAGGPVEGLGVLAPDKRGFWDRLAFRTPQRALMIVAQEPKAGLAASQMPNPADYENTSWGYAGQWFFFALTALVIYILALRRRSVSRRKD